MRTLLSSAAPVPCWGPFTALLVSHEGLGISVASAHSGHSLLANTLKARNGVQRVLASHGRALLSTKRAHGRPPSCGALALEYTCAQGETVCSHAFLAYTYATGASSRGQAKPSAPPSVAASRPESAMSETSDDMKAEKEYNHKVCVSGWA